jgi:hypothetical protein
MVFVTFVSVGHTFPSQMIELRDSTISVLLKELETGYRVPKLAGDLSVLCYASDLPGSHGAPD